MLKPLSFIALLCVFIFPTTDCYAGVDDLSVTDYQLIAKKRDGDAYFEYTFAVTVTNAGGPLNDVMGTLTSSARTTVIIDAELNLGDIGSGATTSTDTIKFRQDRRIVFKPSNLFWSFTAEEPPTNTPPVADAGPDQGVAVGDMVTLDGSGSSDLDMDALTYDWSLMTPAGSTAVLSSTSSVAPSFTADIAGDYVATLIVNDGTDDSAPDGVTISATFIGTNPPSIDTSPVTSGSVNETYSYDVDASDPDVGDMLIYSLMQAPAGMTIDPTSGVISWLPDTPGPADVDVLVTDSTDLTDRQIYLILVNNGNDDQPPTLAPIADQNTIVGQGIMVIAVGTDPEGETLRYGLTSAPAGMAINTGNGELLWTPALDQPGNFSATVSVTDPGGQMASESFDIEVLAETPNNPPVIDPVVNQPVDPLVPVQLTLTASDPDEGDILTFGLTGAPAALQFDGLTGDINWIPSPDDAGITNLTATVTDSAGDTDMTSFNIIVSEPPFPPIAVDDAYAIDRDAVLQVAADGVLANDTDANNDVLTASNTTLPTLGTLDLFPGDGSFNYTPPQNPDITIGLRERCRSAEHIQGSAVLVADIDHDGETEIIGWDGGGFTSHMWLMDGSDCSLKGPVIALPFATYGVMAPQTTPALANLDADPDLEIIVVRAGPPTLGGNRARLVALNFDGSLVWSLPDGASEAISGDVPFGNNYYANRGPTIADLNGDGSPEILMPLAYDPGAPVFNFLGGIVAYNADGTILWEFAGVEQSGASFGKPLHVVDLDLDGTLEVIYHTNVVDHEGNLEFNLQTDPGANFHPPQLTIAIANFDTDPFPEIVGQDSGRLYLFEHTPGPATWTILHPNSSRGEITVGDYDGDGLPEFVIHSGLGTGVNAGWMEAFDTDGSPLWSFQGTTYDSHFDPIGADIAFDYDQDGKDEITSLLRTNNEGEGIFIFDGDTGTEIAKTTTFDGGALFVPNGFSMFPTIADVDNDNTAEIVFVARPGGGESFVYILEGLEGNPFPPARPIRNQRMYQPTHVDLDGYVPTYPRPQWLIPGLNKYNFAAVIPFEDPGVTDSFLYTASDATATSNEATVTIAVTNVNPPVIVSRPAQGASPGFDYLYGLLITDADFGDTFSFTLVDAPTGMSVDTFGLVTWFPDVGDLGTHRVHIVVTDDQGNTDEQTFVIEVIPPVTVPDLVGSDETMASDALENAGLAVGSITQAYNLTVPAGEVISQSIMSGADSAAGAFINFVISLGPQPIFVPSLVNVNEPVAQNLLESVSLVLGTVTRANSDTVLAGLVLSQSIAPNAQVEINTVVDITVSSGPAVVLELDRPLVGAGDSLPIVITVFDNDGIALAPQPPVGLSVEFEPGTVVGTLPTANITAITTAGETSGAFELVVDAGGFGTAQAPFIVRRGLVPGDYYEPIAEFMELIDDAQAVYTQLITAVADNDLGQIETLGTQLVALRDAIDLEVLADRTPSAPESGFLPTLQQANDAGFLAGFEELTQLPIIYARVETSINDSRTFLENLNPAIARDDDVRARFLNTQLEASFAELLNFNVSIAAQMAVKTESYLLFSRQIPGLVVSDLDASIAALEDNGLLVRAPVKGPIAKPGPVSRGDFHADRNNRFFTIGGLMSGSAVRMTLIKNMYVPYITRLISAGLVIAQADALLANSAVGSINSIITGASLSLHVFNAPNSAIEVAGLADDSRAFNVKLVGPDKFQAWLNFVTDASIPTSFDDLEKLISAAADAAAGSLAGIQTAVAHDIIPGCIFEFAPDCSQLVIGFGFPVTHTSGVFPAPVLIILRDVSDGKLYAGVFAFFPN